jgi:channel protein (hemolysin III family)
MDNQIISIPGFSEPFSSFSHLFFIPFYIALAVILWLRYAKNNKNIFVTVIFNVGVIVMLSLSGTYHILEPKGTPRYVLQILDHDGIFFLIATSFTALHLAIFKGMKRWLILLFIWPAAITAITLKSIFFKSVPAWLSLVLFLFMGWVGVISGYLLYKEKKMVTLKLLIVGGFFYSLGALIEFTKYLVIIPGVVGPHEIFHLFVLAGIVAHWKMLYSLKF